MKVAMSFYKRQIGHEHYTYDANGNPTRVENDSTAAVREMYWELGIFYV